jgi:hypothetical protein
VKLVTIPHVPLAKTGTYNLSSGTTTFTEEDLMWAAQAINAAGVRNPIIKFGHEKKQLTQQPAVGRVTNLVYEAATQTLFGDYVGVPEWLADIMPIAYPDRSVEGWRNVDIQGRKHLFVITAVSLLGEDAPGVDTLEDLYELFYPDGEPVAAEADGPQRVAVIIKGGGMAEPVAASVEVADITRAYYEGVGFEWWIRSVRLDPNELIVDNDDEGKLYRVPFEINGEEVTFGDPVEVKIRYEDVAAQLAATGAPLAVFASRAESRPGTSERKETTVADKATDDLAPIREKLGLPADATQEDILKALDSDPKPDPQETEEQEAEQEQPAEPAIAARKDGTVTVDAETWAQVQANARRGAETAKRLAERERDEVLDAAILAGKFPVSRRDHYLKAWKADPQGTQQLLAEMAPGLVPVEQRGSDNSGDVAASREMYPSNWLPDVAAKKEMAARMPSGTVLPGTIIREEV